MPNTVHSPCLNGTSVPAVKTGNKHANIDPEIIATKSGDKLLKEMTGGGGNSKVD